MGDDAARRGRIATTTGSASSTSIYQAIPERRGFVCCFTERLARKTKPTLKQISRRLMRRVNAEPRASPKAMAQNFRVPPVRFAAIRTTGWAGCLLSCFIPPHYFWRRCCSISISPPLCISFVVVPPVPKIKCEQNPSEKEKLTPLSRSRNGRLNDKEPQFITEERHWNDQEPQ